MQKRLRRGGKNTQNYSKRKKKNDLRQPDNHDGVVTHLEHDILECEVKCALGSITTNKTSGDNRIPAELFKTLKDDAVKVVYSICQQIRKLSRGHRRGKGQFLFHFQRSNLKECSNSHTIVLISCAGKVMLKILQAQCQQNMN